MYQFIERTTNTIEEINTLKTLKKEMSALAAAGNVYTNNCPLFKKLNITPDHKEAFEIMVNLPFQPNIEKGEMPDYLKGFECYYEITYATGEVRKKDKYDNYYYEEVSTDKPRIIGAYRKEHTEGIKVKTTVFRYKYSISYVIEIIDNHITNLKQMLKYDLQEIEHIKEKLNTLELDITKIL